MKKWIRCTGVVSLALAMTALPLTVWQMNHHDAPEPDVAQPLLSLHSQNGGTDSPIQNLVTIEDSSVPLASPVVLANHGQSVPCTIGLLNYYNQGDPRWADQLYGPTDPMRSHGCGPTAVAMIVSSYTGYSVTPMDVAAWASQNGYCSPGEGSKHQLIPDGLAHYNLTVTSLPDRSTQTIIDTINSGKIVVALMNKGRFTNGGHFLLLTQVTEDGKIRIADPASWENSNITWDPDFLLNEVRKKSDGGGPLWAVEMPPEI